ncbi:MAG: DUF167 domain-containing protein [Thermoguttaceae bacterium]
MTALQAHPEGTILLVHARAGARRSQLRACQDGTLGVWVTQAPEKGKANNAIVEILAAKLSLRKSQLELLSGQTSPRKRFLVRGLRPDELLGRVRSLLEGD